jgi:hypothetical protein
MYHDARFREFEVQRGHFHTNNRKESSKQDQSLVNKILCSCDRASLN